MKAYPTEAALCAAFTEQAEAHGWDVYAEIGAWDLVIVHRGPHGVIPTGAQVGVQAKLRPTLGLVEQLTRDPGARIGPDVRAMLLPEWHLEASRIARNLGAALLRPTSGNSIERLILPESWNPPRVWRTPETRLWLPPVKPSYSGGAPCPRKLSRWRVGALKLCARLRRGEPIVAADFRAAGLSASEPSSWRRRAWVERVGKGPQAVYFLGPRSAGLPDVGYEAERDAIAALP